MEQESSPLQLGNFKSKQEQITTLFYNLIGRIKFLTKIKQNILSKTFAQTTLLQLLQSQAKALKKLQKVYLNKIFKQYPLTKNQHVYSVQSKLQISRNYEQQLKQFLKLQNTSQLMTLKNQLEQETIKMIMKTIQTNSLKTEELKFKKWQIIKNTQTLEKKINTQIQRNVI